jgi:hypothetical protein
MTQELENLKPPTANRACAWHTQKALIAERPRMSGPGTRPNKRHVTHAEVKLGPAGASRRKRTTPPVRRKHQHARDALEHYRSAAKDQRDQDHGATTAALQAELRQLRQEAVFARRTSPA